jgi:membrane-associated phospholipid phosphatase
MWLELFDHSVIHWLNQYADSSILLNHAVSFISEASIFKGLPIMALYCYLWLSRTSKKMDTQAIILATLLGCFIALVAARILNNTLPFHPRPIADHSFFFHPLAGLMHPDENALIKWNSFPSDHAALFFGLATGIFLISRWLGLLVFLDVLLFIVLPRLYLGLHYPSDILGGAFLGVVSVASCVCQKKIRKWYDVLWLYLLKRYPAAFYTILYVISFEISDMFDDIRNLANWLIKHYF